jgi:putative flippase GtrA
MKRRSVAEIARFGVATGITACITLGVPVALHEGFSIDERVAVAVALAVAFVVNFFTTRLFVFQSRGDSRQELWRFLGVNLGFRVTEYGLFLLLFSLGLVYVVAQFIVLALSFVLKFIVQRRFVYRQQDASGD